MKYYCIFETKSGYIALAGKDGKLTQCTLPKSSSEAALDALHAGLDSSFVEDIAAFGDLPARFKRYFEGERVDFSQVPLNLDGRGRFQADTLLAAQRISYGELMSYRELAVAAGSPRAARAVGNAMASNTTPIIVPCHRVVTSDGKIGGFSSGLDWKRTLLKLEGVNI